MCIVSATTYCWKMQWKSHGGETRTFLGTNHPLSSLTASSGKMSIIVTTDTLTDICRTLQRFSRGPKMGTYYRRRQTALKTYGGHFVSHFRSRFSSKRMHSQCSLSKLIRQHPTCIHINNTKNSQTPFHNSKVPLILSFLC